jgi:hypothetical protein
MNLQQLPVSTFFFRYFQRVLSEKKGNGGGEEMPLPFRPFPCETLGILLGACYQVLF